MGVVIKRRNFSRAFIKHNCQSGNQVSSSKSWHVESANAVLASLNTTPDGLSTDETTNRLAKYGPNRLPETKLRGPLIRFFYQFHNVLIYVLIIACVITAILGHWVDASVILGVVLINAAIGFVQEGKAENALRAIRQMLSPNARVMREGRQMTIRAEDLVPGDIVLLQSGDKVPADLRLFRIKGLQVQEAALTGESVAVEKNTEAVAQAAVTGDRRCMAYSGTLVTHGQGDGVVVATGMNTELGHISTLVADVE
ncbi:MAG: HAD-IC family P-type ATPase, partial [Nitrosomonas sp.]|nr:HAD-IC family P-type ATPase [Nitrosomonas sp.]